jgi:hypothetical protein
MNSKKLERHLRSIRKKELIYFDECTALRYIQERHVNAKKNLFTHNMEWKIIEDQKNRK